MRRSRKLASVSHVDGWLNVEWYVRNLNKAVGCFIMRPRHVCERGDSIDQGMGEGTRKAGLRWRDVT